MMNVVNTKSDREATVNRTHIDATFSVAMKISAEERDRQMWLEVGKRIRAYREKRRWTQEQCAEWAGMKRQQWHRIEQGASTKRKTLLRIAEVLDIDPEEVLSWAGQILPSSTDRVVFGFPLTPETTRLLTIFGDLPDDTKQDVFLILEALWRRHASRGELPTEDTARLPQQHLETALLGSSARKMLKPYSSESEMHPTDAEVEQSPASQPQLPISRPAAVMSDPKGEDGDPDKKPPSAIKKDLQDAQRDRIERKTKID